jgi:hypothetical protein
MLDADLATYGCPKGNSLPVDNPQLQADATEYNRLAEHVAQLTRTAWRAVISFQTILAGAPQTGAVVEHRTLWGSGVTQEPAIAKTGTGVYTLTFSTTYLDGLGEQETVGLLFADATSGEATYSDPRAKVTSANVVTVRVWDAGGSPTDGGGGHLVTVFVR